MPPRGAILKDADPSYLCYVSQRTGDGVYRHGRMPLHFPASAITPEGQTQRFQYRVESPERDPLFVANCAIPATPRAVEVMHRIFFVENRPSRRHDGGDGGTAIMSTCPKEGCTSLDPIVVIGYPSSGAGSTRGEDCNWYNTFGCDTSMIQWYENDGTENPDSGGYEEEVYIPVEDQSCPNCGEKLPSDDQLETIEKAIELVQCASMRDVLRERLPFMQVFTQQSPIYADPANPVKDLGFHANGVIYIWEGLWRHDAQGNPVKNADGDLVVRSQSQFVETLVHEAAHAWWSYYQKHFDGSTTHHAKWKATMAECGYPNAY